MARDRKWSRRHVAVVWSALAVSLAGLTILGVSTALIAHSRDEANPQRHLATKEKDKAIDQRDLARLNHTLRKSSRDRMTCKNETSHDFTKNYSATCRWKARPTAVAGSGTIC